MSKSWYSIKVVPIENATSEAEINIYDEIGMWGIDAKAFNDEFSKIKNLSKIKVSINSPGGSVFDGISIYNMLNEVRDKVEVEVIGLAASIASIIAMSGSKVSMRQGTNMMIHNPWTIAIGDSDEMRKEADTLDKIKESLVNIYTTKSNLSEDDIVALMDEETWLSPAEAKAMGFVDEIDEGERIAASFNKSVAEYGFLNTPVKEVGNPKGEMVIKAEMVVKGNDIVAATLESNADKTTERELIYQEEIKELQAKILKFKIDNKVK